MLPSDNELFRKSAINLTNLLFFSEIIAIYGVPQQDFRGILTEFICKEKVLP
jgi:hypothetical protein